MEDSYASHQYDDSDDSFIDYEEEFYDRTSPIIGMNRYNPNVAKVCYPVIYFQAIRGCLCYA